MQIDSLKSSITTLKKLRDAYHSQLDAIVLDELDGVIAELTRHSDKQEKEWPLGIPKGRVLEIIAQIISIATNIADLMK